MSLYCAHFAFIKGKLMYYQENMGGCKVCNEETRMVECEEVGKLRADLAAKTRANEMQAYRLKNQANTIKNRGEAIERLEKENEELRTRVRSKDNALRDYGNAFERLTKENISLKETVQSGDSDNQTIIDLQESVKSLQERVIAQDADLWIWRTTADELKKKLNRALDGQESSAKAAKALEDRINRAQQVLKGQAYALTFLNVS